MDHKMRDGMSADEIAANLRAIFVALNSMEEEDLTTIELEFLHRFSQTRPNRKRGIERYWEAKET